MPTLYIILSVVAVIIVIIILAKCIRTVPQGKVFLIERLGQFDEIWEAGLHLKTPFIRSVRSIIPVCELTTSVPESSAITKDNVTINIDAMLFYKIFDPKLYTYGVRDHSAALHALSQSMMRNLVGCLELDECLSSRETISREMTRTLDEATDKWGIKILRVEIKNIIQPRDIQESMERQMKADRERREQLIRAEADKKASILAAEKDKAVKLLAAESARDAAALNAEANRIAVIREAEVYRDSELICAEAAKEARIKEAEAEAEAIRAQGKAKAEGIKYLNEARPSDAVMQLKAYETLEKLASTESNKIIVPNQLQGIVGAATILKDSLSSK